MSTIAQSRPIHMTPKRWLAVVCQLVSWLATLWLVQWVWTGAPLPAQLLAAVVVEFMFFMAKEQLFTGGELWIGWLGLAIDTIANMGGFMPGACRVITFPPIHVLVSFAHGLEPGQLLGCTPFQPASLVIALIGGIIFSVAPHRLWR